MGLRGTSEDGSMDNDTAGNANLSGAPQQTEPYIQELYIDILISFCIDISIPADGYGSALRQMGSPHGCSYSHIQQRSMDRPLSQDQPPPDITASWSSWVRRVPQCRTHYDDDRKKMNIKQR
jgi:hypothetical protein